MLSFLGEDENVQAPKPLSTARMLRSDNQFLTTPLVMHYKTSSIFDKQNSGRLSKFKNQSHNHEEKPLKFLEPLK